MADPTLLCRELAGRLSAGARTPWPARWRRAEERAQEAIGKVLAGYGPTEPGVARALVEALPDGATLVSSSSMPVRDVEWYAAPRDGLRHVANRGANGIDGVVSTAVGVALGSAAPTALLIGDIALLHDTNGLLGLRERAADLTIVVVDNDGGGIFSFLPQATAVPRRPLRAALRHAPRRRPGRPGRRARPADGRPRRTWATCRGCSATGPASSGSGPTAPPTSPSTRPSTTPSSPPSTDGRRAPPAGDPTRAGVRVLESVRASEYDSRPRAGRADTWWGGQGVRSTMRPALHRGLLLAVAVVRVGGRRLRPPSPRPRPRRPPRRRRPCRRTPGSGRRIVYDMGTMHVWLVESDGTVIRDYPVSGHKYRKLPGTGVFWVYSKSRYTGVANSPTRMEFMVRFAKGNTGTGDRLPQHPDQARPAHRVRVARSARRRRTAASASPIDNAEFLFSWAQEGTLVNVIDTTGRVPAAKANAFPKGPRPMTDLEREMTMPLLVAGSVRASDPAPGYGPDDGREHGLELGLRLGQLGPRLAVGHDAAAGEEARRGAVDLGAADGHRPRPVAGPVDPAHRAAVAAASKPSTAAISSSAASRGCPPRAGVGESAGPARARSAPATTAGPR